MTKFKCLLIYLALQNSCLQAQADQSLAVFNNLQCQRGYICIDLDAAEAFKVRVILKFIWLFVCIDFSRGGKITNLHKLKTWITTFSKVYQQFRT